MGALAPWATPPLPLPLPTSTLKPPGLLRVSDTQLAHPCLLQYEGTCISGFVPVGESSQVVLGVPFLRAWHSQYSYDPTTQKAKIGLAAPVSTAGTPASNGAGTVLSFAGRKLAQVRPITTPPPWVPGIVIMRLDQVVSFALHSEEHCQF